MRRSRVVASACAAALLATSMASPASANSTKREKAAATVVEAVFVCDINDFFFVPNFCETFNEILIKISGG